MVWLPNVRGGSVVFMKEQGSEGRGVNRGKCEGQKCHVGFRLFSEFPSTRLSRVLIFVFILFVQTLIVTWKRKCQRLLCPNGWEFIYLT